MIKLISHHVIMHNLTIHNILVVLRNQSDYKVEHDNQKEHLSHPPEEVNEVKLQLGQESQRLIWLCHEIDCRRVDVAEAVFECYKEVAHELTDAFETFS